MKGRLRHGTLAFMTKKLTIIGGGLAGCEACWQAARTGCEITLYEMKPKHFTPAHSSKMLGELVCSNSLRSDDPTSAVGLLKLEMEMLGSLVMEAARATAVPAGKALAVDRELFAAYLTEKIGSLPNVEIISEKIDQLPDEGLVVLASGPLTADELAQSLANLTGESGLHFYDAIAPIVTAESVDMEHAFWADRYGDGPGDYLNCPLTREEYDAFYQALSTAEQVPLRDFENPKFFEGCLPVEVMASRGPKTLLFGPMKPVGLRDPQTGDLPHAVVQLRKEDADGRMLNMVGFQTKLTYKAQEQVFRLIPALANAEFARLGSIHRNTFLDAPRLLNRDLTLAAAPHVFAAGQLSGVEGYVESAASGLLCGLNAGRRLKGLDPVLPPPETAFGGLLTHLANTETKRFQPSNINFGLLPSFDRKIPKKQKGYFQHKRAVTGFVKWLNINKIEKYREPPALDPSFFA